MKIYDHILPKQDTGYVPEEMCDWRGMRLKDRRKGFVWRCGYCEKMARGKRPPVCPIGSVRLPEREGEAA